MNLKPVQISLEGENLESIDVALAHRQKKGSKVVHSDRKAKSMVVSQESGFEPATGQIPLTTELEISARQGMVSPDNKDLAQRIPKSSGVSEKIE